MRTTISPSAVPIRRRQQLLLLARPRRQASRSIWPAMPGGTSGRLFRFNRLYEASRKPGPIIEASCWPHARLKLFDLARINRSHRSRLPSGRSIDVLFDNRARDQRRAAAQAPAGAQRARPAAWSSRWRRLREIVSAAGSSIRAQRRCQGDQYSLNRLDRAHPLPRRRPPMHVEQCSPNEHCAASTVGRHNWTIRTAPHEGGRITPPPFTTLVGTAKLATSIRRHEAHRHLGATGTVPPS